MKKKIIKILEFSKKINKNQNLNDKNISKYFKLLMIN